MSRSTHVQATFEDGLEAEALAKRHSLTREAVAIGAEAGAYRTILTHFSQVNMVAKPGKDCEGLSLHLHPISRPNFDD